MLTTAIKTIGLNQTSSSNKKSDLPTLPISKPVGSKKTPKQPEDLAKTWRLAWTVNYDDCGPPY